MSSHIHISRLNLIPLVFHYSVVCYVSVHHLKRGSTLDTCASFVLSG